MARRMNKAYRIKLIKPVSADKVLLYLQPHLLVPLKADSLLRLKVSTGQQLSDSNFMALIKQSLSDLLLELALRLIAQSPQAPFLLSKKLTKSLGRLCQKYNYPQDYCSSDLVTQTLAYLDSHNLLNPSDFIESFVRRHRLKPRLFLLARLKQLGFDSFQVESYLPQPENQVDAVRQIILKKDPDSRIIRSPSQLLRLKAQLYRRGFSLQTINAAIDDILTSR
jgi:SOS response regulatory protein OraA/RecX